jgi:hypothetical protein
VDKHIVAEEDPLDSIVEEAWIVPGNRSGMPEQESQNVVPQAGPSSHEQPKEQSYTQPVAQPRQEATTVTWRFTTADARIKLKRLYPSLEPRKRSPTKTVAKKS